MPLHRPGERRRPGHRTGSYGRGLCPGVGVLADGQQASGADARELLTSGGGTGYLLKDRISRPREFVEALVTVATGGTVLAPEVVTQMFASAPPPHARAPLPEREQHALKRI